MKKILLLLSIIGLALVYSCSKDGEASNPSDFSISLTSNFTTRYTGEQFTFTVLKSDGSNITNEAVITANGATVTGGVFNPGIVGTYNIVATYGGKSSLESTVYVTASPIPLQSITISPNSSTVSKGDNITFTVTGNNGTNYTSTSQIYVNGAISNTTYPTTVTGVLNVYATYTTNANVVYTSPTIQVTVLNAINFNKRVLIEDFTGTWCGYCPRVSYGIELVNQQTTDATEVAIHRGNDPYNFTGAGALETQINLTGYPTAMLNRTTSWNYPEPSNVSQVVALTNGTKPRLGLAMNTSVSGNTATIEVKTKFGASFTNLKLVVYALEDNLVYNQTNYTSYYGGASTIANFDHDHVLRATLTNILGDDITGNTNVDDEFTRTFTYTIPANVNASNLKFAAFVIDSSKKAINSREADANGTQTFEIE